MYCQNCGSATQPTNKYCNRCGTQLVPPNEKQLRRRRKSDWTSIWTVCSDQRMFAGFILGGAIR